jgi:hypothetical protein
MLEPETVTADLIAKFEKQYPQWAQAKRQWPLTVSLQPPSTDVRLADPVPILEWAQRWRSWSGPGRVAFAARRFTTGTFDLPQRITFDVAAQVAALTPATAATWQRCGDRLIALHEAFPNLALDAKNIRGITQLPDDDFRRLADTARWLCDHPRSGLLPRQLPVEGISTKWLEHHLALVAGITGRDAVAAEEGPQAAAGLYESLGLRSLPRQIPVLILDPALRAAFGGMRHFQAGVDDLNAWTQTPETILITENKQTAYALEDEHLQGTVVMHSMGFHTDLYARVHWVRDARSVIYWGDLDTFGLEALNKLRANGIKARSILTDIATFERYARLAVPAPIPKLQAVTHLDADERALYAALLDHARQQGEGILLEQERIPWDLARAAIHTALNLAI